MPGRNHGNARNRQIQFLRSSFGNVADDFSRIDNRREQRFFQAERAENFIGEPAACQIRELRRSRHRAIGRHHARQAIRENVGNEEPRGGFFQKFGAVFLEPDQLVNRVEGKRADTGNAVERVLRNVFPDVCHHVRRARTFPGNDGIKQFALCVDECAVHAERGNRDCFDFRRGNAFERLARAIRELAQNTVGVPMVKLRIFRRGNGRVRLGSLTDDFSGFVNEHRAYIRRAAIQTQDKHFFEMRN